MNRLAGLRRVYASPAEAAEACRRAGYVGHELPELRQIHLDWPQMISDYPVQLRLATIAGRRLFDFGGSVGNVHYAYGKRVAAVARWEWTVYDLPELVEAGRELARERGNTALRFTTELSAGRDCDLALFSGSLHYWEGSIAELFDRIGSLPPHVLINRSPMRDRGDDLNVIQSGHAAFPCRLRSRERLEAAFAALGYELVDHWTEPELAYRLTLLPDYSASGYHGFYFRLAAKAAAEPQARQAQAELAS